MNWFSTFFLVKIYLGNARFRFNGCMLQDTDLRSTKKNHTHKKPKFIIV